MSNKKGEKKTKGAGRFKKDGDEAFFNETPPGMLKDLSKPLISEYDPPTVEAAWDSYWECNGCYRADEDDKTKETFVMVIPPPNVTGTLHLGHALTSAVEDSLVRWHRMNGRNVLWVPGVDHAGIATQTVVEKKLMREEKKTRHDVGREAFLKKVWAWKEQNGSKICRQLRRMGASVDWSREVFTMDDMLSEAVKEAFLRMHKKGRIFRANRMVNYSCTLRTAISNIEVEPLDIDQPVMRKVPGYDKPVEFGVLHEFGYKVKNHPELPPLIVATTRIETMLGDVAVAVHPNDKRYTKYHGKELIHPFIKDRKMIVVTDDILVDMTFGTGAVKVTPAHDENDFNCGKRHKLPQINILNNDGTINENGGEYKGMHRYQCRDLIVPALEKVGLYKGKQPNKMVLGLCSRSGDVVEPVLRPQWWVDCKDMARRSVNAVKKGDLKIVPEFHKQTWYHWLDDCHDWCISRQLWWGHRIPAYFVTIKGEPEPDNANAKNWIVARSEEEAWTEAVKRFKLPKEKLTPEQDPDVLDTWFSSGLFPFSVMGWPKKTKDLSNFFPGHLLETGHDILFFWVARMVMMSLELTDSLPFKTIYLHAMVRDKFGRKMSKSLGNVIDPIDVITGITLKALGDKLRNGNLDPREVEKALKGQKRDYPEGIAECGTDALRLGLLAFTTQGRDINLDIFKVLSYRQFCNKVWNVLKFLKHYLKGVEESGHKWKVPTVQSLNKEHSKHLNLMDQWILSRLAACTAETNMNFEQYQFGDVVKNVFQFWKHELCDVYMEVIKPVLWDESSDGQKKRLAALNTLALCMDFGLRLLHPLMPYVTEELYHRLPGKTFKPPTWAPVQRSAKSATPSSSKKGGNRISAENSRVCLATGRQFASAAERMTYQRQTGLKQALPAEHKMELDPNTPKSDDAGSKAVLEDPEKDPVIIASRLSRKDPDWRAKRAEAAKHCIILAQYPTEAMTKHWRNETVEAQMEEITMIAATTRSMLTSFNVSHKKSEPFLQCSDKKTANLIEKYNKQTCSLAFCQKIKVLLSKETIPKGCVSTVVSKDLTLALEVKGNLDLVAELIKLQAKDKGLRAQLAGYEKIMDPAKWSKIKKEVQDKISQEKKIADGELKKVLESISTFTKVIQDDPEQLKNYQTSRMKILQKDLAKATKQKDTWTKKKQKAEASGKEVTRKTLAGFEGAVQEFDRLTQQIEALKSQLA